MYTEYLYNNSLAHHGIKGQRWGKLNGPPYPLDYKSHSVLEKKENPKVKIDGTASASIKTINKASSTQVSENRNEEESKQKKKLTDKQKRALKIAGAAVVTTAIVGLSIYAIKKYGNNKAAKEAFNKAADSLKDESLDGFMDITNDVFNNETSYGKIKDAIKKCNPGFDSWNPADKNNCGNACLAAEEQIRGIDVFARKNTDGLHMRDIAGCFKNVDSKQFADANNYMPNVPFDEYKKNISNPQYAKEHAAKVKQAFEKTIVESFPDTNARGVFNTEMYGGETITGHWMMWVKEGSSVKFLNPQKDVPQNAIDQYFSRVKTNSTQRNTIFRFDNLEISDNINNFVSSTSAEQIFDTFNAVQEGTNFLLKLK